MVPNTEMNGLMLTLEEAISLAVSGYLADGYDCLVAGLRQAELQQGQGHGWADELVRRYRDSLEAYVVRYGVRLD